MIYLTGANGTIGRELTKRLEVYPISYRDVYPEIEFQPNSTLIHLSTSINARNSLDNFEGSFLNDVSIPLRLFKEYLSVNPFGKIIFLSSAGDLHSQDFFSSEYVNENSTPEPKSLYGAHKLLLENYLKLLHLDYPNFRSLIFRVSNVYGGEPNPNKTTGLVDKLLNSDDRIEIYSNLNSVIDIIHVDDLMNLLIESIIKFMNAGNYLFLVGNERYTILEIIEKISKFRRLNLSIEPTTRSYTYINLDCKKVKEYFSWKCEKFLYNIGE